MCSQNPGRRWWAPSGWGWLRWRRPPCTMPSASQTLTFSLSLAIQKAHFLLPNIEASRFLQKVFTKLFLSYLTVLSAVGHFSKCFHHTELVDVVHNHAPIFCMSEEDSRNCSVFFVDPAIAKLNHYKGFISFLIVWQCKLWFQRLVLGFYKQSATSTRT